MLVRRSTCCACDDQAPLIAHCTFLDREGIISALTLLLFHVLPLTGIAGFEPTINGFEGHHVIRYVICPRWPAGLAPAPSESQSGALLVELQPQCSRRDLNPTSPARKAGMIGLTTLREQALGVGIEPTPDHPCTRVPSDRTLALGESNPRQGATLTVPLANPA